MEAKYVRSIVVVSLALLASSAQIARADDAVSLETLRKEKVKAAQDWVDRVWGTSRDEVNLLAVLPAYRALMDAQLEIAQNKQQRVKARIDYCNAAEGVYSKINLLSQEGMVGGEQWRLAESRFRVVEAQVLLREEELK